jgi:hypothetical protein
MDSRTLKMAKVFDSVRLVTVVTWVEEKGGRVRRKSK